MINTIENDRLKVSIHSKGAQLWSVQDRTGHEYLWQGDPAYWPRRGPLLFPYIGRLTDGRYLYEGREYSLHMHGFLRDTELRTEQTEKNSIRFFMDNNPCMEQYPFSFRLAVQYRLTENRIEISFSVWNTDQKTMYFGFGGHPGFRVPLTEGLPFEQYYLDFGAPGKPSLIMTSETCYPTGEEKEFSLEDGRFLPLRHALFDHDAIILKNTTGQITLKSKADTRSITVCYPDMKYLGLWHTPHKNAPFVCIEPWTSLPSRDGTVTDLKAQADLISLEAGKEYRNRWSIEIVHAFATGK